MSFLLYGANGYTGRLAAELAASRGLKPTLAGRSADKVRPLAERLRLPWRAFALEDASALDEALRGHALVLHCAGPFSQTSRPMVDACLRARVHYLDVTGEIEVFESIFARDREAKERGVTLLPGVGFDVVPTDCLAALLKRALPTATELELAFAPEGRGGLSSAGTAKTSLEGLAQGGRVRRGGKLVEVPLGSITKEVEFPHGRKLTMAIPWGDVATAYRSTGIPNITVYVRASPSTLRGARLMRLLAPALRFKPLLSFLQARIGARVNGPSEESRKTGRIHVWGRVSDGQRSIEGRMTVPEGYTFTAESSLAAVRRLLEDNVPRGALTPSLAFGPEFAATLPGVTVQIG
jgi:saccharopine dehydrogenase (NAD+, L-lysine-forming)